MVRLGCIHCWVLGWGYTSMIWDTRASWGISTAHHTEDLGVVGNRCKTS